MQEYLRSIILILQLALFLLGRVLDDLSWHDVGVPNETATFEGIGVAAMAICVALQVLRKYHLDGWWKLLFVRSQLKFGISWALVGTIVMLFMHIFGCHSTIPDDGTATILTMIARDCALNVTQLILTNLNLSLIANTKSHMGQFILYEAILFAQVIYNGNLFLLFINDLEGKEKDYSILFISLIISNQILVMDLIFRAAYEDREREEEEEEKMLGHVKQHQQQFQSNITIDPPSINAEAASSILKAP